MLRSRPEFQKSCAAGTERAEITVEQVLRELVSIGKHLGMFVERSGVENRHCAISDEPMSAEEWKKRYVTSK